MDPRLMTRQVMDFNKFIFDNSFSSMAMMQDLSGKLMRIYMDQIPWVPEEGKRIIDEWMSAFRNGRDRFKLAVDENYMRAGECLRTSVNPAAAAMGQPVK